MGYYENLREKARITRLEDLEKMHTRELLGILQALRSNYNYNWWDERDELLDDFKNLVKSVLATREHIPNKLEAKKIRQEKAKRKK